VLFLLLGKIEKVKTFLISFPQYLAKEQFGHCYFHCCYYWCSQ